MAPLITLYILGGCVAAAAVLFVVMIVLTALRPPQLPDVPTDHHAALDRVLRALTPLPFATAAAAPHMIAPPANVPPPPRRPILRVASPPPEQQAAPAATPASAASAAPLSPTAFLQRKPRPVAPVAPAQRPAGTLPPPPAPAQRPTGTLPPPPAPAQHHAPATPPPPAPAQHHAPAIPPRPAARAAVTLPPVPPRARALETYKPIITPLGPAKRQVTQKVRGHVTPRAGHLPVYPAKRARWLVRIVVGLFTACALAAGAVVAYPAMIDPLCDDYEWFGADAAQIAREYARDANAAISQLAHDTGAFYAVDLDAR